MSIDTAKLKPSGTQLSVQPSNRLFEELGRNTYSYLDLLSELIDNAIAARVDGHQLTVTIDILTDDKGVPEEFVISDDAGGIPPKKFADAVSPGAIQTQDSLNEHGLGMKQAVPALGRLNYLAT